MVQDLVGAQHRWSAKAHPEGAAQPSKADPTPCCFARTMDMCFPGSTMDWGSNLYQTLSRAL
jgi:hypothetical protein